MGFYFMVNSCIIHGDLNPNGAWLPWNVERKEVNGVALGYGALEVPKKKCSKKKY
jgi:hypothetical protein